MSDTTTATVETLTAEVRVLQVGSRQITLSVARQLDSVPYADLEPMGRIRPGGDDRLIGRHRSTGALVTAEMPGRIEEYGNTYYRFTTADLAGKCCYRNEPVQISNARMIYPDECQRRTGDDNRPVMTGRDWGRLIARADALRAEADALPLIVLAGLR